MPQTKGRPKKGLRGGKNLRNINKKYNEVEENNNDEESGNDDFELVSSSSQSVLDYNNNKTSLSDIISSSQKRKSMNFEEDDGFVFRRASQQSVSSSQPSKASLESYQNKLQSDAITPLRKPYQPYVPRSVRAKKEAEEAQQAASLKHQKLKSRMRILSPIKAKKIPVKKKTELEKAKEEDPKPKRGRKKSTPNPSEAKEKTNSLSLFSNNKPNSKKPNSTPPNLQSVSTKPPSLNSSVFPPLSNNDLNVPKLSQSKNTEKDPPALVAPISSESASSKIQDPVKKTRKKAIRKPATTKVTKSKATSNKNSSSKRSDKTFENSISLLDAFSLIDDDDGNNNHNGNNGRSTFKFHKTSNNNKPKIQVFSFDSPEKEASPEPISKKRKITESPRVSSKKGVNNNVTDKSSKSKRNAPREKTADDKNKLKSKNKKGETKNGKREVIESNEQLIEEFDPFINALDDPIQEDDTPFVEDVENIFTEKYTRASLIQSPKSSSDGMESAEEGDNNGVEDIVRVAEDDDSGYESAEIERIPLTYSPSKKTTTNTDRTSRRNSQDRRLSLSNRGKRLSSIGNGFVAEPHEDVPVDDFYKHLDSSLPEPHRMRQLLIWSCKRLISREKKLNEDYKLTESGYSDLSIKIANSIKEEMVKDLVDGKINTSWWVMDDDDEAENKINSGAGSDLSNELSQSSQSSQNNINKPIIILPNEQNQKNLKSLKMLEKRLAECKREDKTWTDCSEYELTNGSNFKEIKIPKDYNEIKGKEAIISSNDNFSKLQAVINQLYESKENYKSKITDELEDSVDDFTHMIHKLKSVMRALEILSDSKMIEFSSKMRESLDKDINGEYSIDSMKLLKGLARLNPSDKD